ncbi:hypothetical protein Sjap_015374 [Stephania japonica]|uniref:E3 UFM1-protein ligase 1-like N-terminal domain-containing protein n=1 Tax=Stephania japonica TaxID=461633 RepID=A0AAP0IJ98_9MAGN
MKSRIKDQLRHEMMMEIDNLGRVSQIELANVVGVDLYHIESKAHCIVVDDSVLMLIKGEIIAQSYWLEGRQLYTPAFVARVMAMVRGATRAITVSMNLSLSLFNGLVKEDEILGSIRAEVHWTLAEFAHAQRKNMDSFFSQIVNTKTLRRYPEGVPLDTVFIHPSMIDMLDSAAEDAIERGRCAGAWLSLSPIGTEMVSPWSLGMALACMPKAFSRVILAFLPYHPQERSPSYNRC